MTKLSAVTLVLLLALYCRAEEHPAAVTPQQVDEIVDQLLSGLEDYVFPEVAKSCRAIYGHIDSSIVPSVTPTLLPPD